MGGEEKLGGAGSGRAVWPGGRGGGARAPRASPRLLRLPLPVPCKQQPELPCARAAEMSSSPPPAGAASAAISASEKVDGFTRKSVRKAQRQKRSQGSSQFRSHGSQAELHPLPQLKGNLRGRSPGGSAGLATTRAEPFLGLLPSRGSQCETCLPRSLAVTPAPLTQTGLMLKVLLLFFSLIHPDSCHLRRDRHPSPPARTLTCPRAEHPLLGVPRGGWSSALFPQAGPCPSCFNNLS